MTLKAVETPEIPAIEFTYDHLNTNNVRGALSKLLNCPAIPQATAYWVGRVGKKLEKDMEKIGKEYFDLVTPYAQKDSSDIPLKDPTGGIKIVEGKEEEFKTKHEEFIKNKITLEWKKLPAKDFERAGLTPNDILALEPMMYGLPE